MELNELLTQANQSAREATTVLQANMGRLDKLPRVTLERIEQMCFNTKMVWGEVEDRIARIRSSQE